jgi:archaeosine synthase beta-subunit
VLSRITTRAWRDEEFLTLLLADPRTALVGEFGEVPEGFENAMFRPCEIDRVISRTTAEGQRLLVRPKRGDRPLSVVTRQVLGICELVVVLYTKRCRYQCTFCTLPSTSAYGDVSFASVRAQLDTALEFAVEQLPAVRQVSLGNEGSILDERTFSREQLEYVLRKCAALPAVEEIVLETRAEFASNSLLDDLVELVSPKRLTLKIGLESADTRIRERVLRKKMDLEEFEKVVYSLGRRGIGLASYVLVKADPAHSDADGREDAIATCRYLKELCRSSGTRLTLRINAMYRAAGSLWAIWAQQQGWTPPSVFDLAEVMYAVADEDVPVFAGLAEEGLATPDGHFEARDDFESWALTALEEHNRSGDLRLLRRVASHRSGGQAL